MEYIGIWSNIIKTDIYCSKCGAKINTYYPSKCIICEKIFCSKCLKRCCMCKNNYCRKCVKLYKFKKGTCYTCYQPKQHCILC